MLAREYSVLGCLLHKRRRFRAHDARGLPHDAPLRQKAGMRMKIVKKSGLPFCCQKPRPCRACSRRGVLYIDNGGALRADMDGQCDGLRDSAGRGYKRDGRALRRLSGDEKKQLDTHTVAEEAMSALPEVSWLSVNIVGCSVNVDVREGVGKSVKKMMRRAI